MLGVNNNESTPTPEQPAQAVPAPELEHVVNEAPATYAPPTYAAGTAQYAPAPPVATTNFPMAPATKGLTISALVVGIAGFLTGLMPIVGIIIGAAGIVLGIMALVKKQPKALALTGLILAAVGFVTSCVTTIGVGAAVNVLAESPAIQSPELVTPEPVIPENDTEAPSDTPAPAPTDVPVEFTSALTKADLYANTMHMSKAGLYDQLTSEYGEQFSAEAGQYAVNNVKTDWNRNALEKAKEYQDLMAMSPDAIRDQLVSEYGEQFTAEEADYALANLNS